MIFMCWIHTCFRLFTSSQKKTNCYPLTNHTWKMSPYYLVKCTTFSSDWRNVEFLQTLVALKRAGCDVWQMECQASNVTANIQSDHVLHRYMLPVFSPLLNRIVHHAVLKFSPCHNKTLPRLVRIVDWYSIRVKKWKGWKICAYYKVVWWHFSRSCR